MASPSHQATPSKTSHAPSQAAAPTRVAQGRILVQGDERRVQQHRIVVLGDDAVVGGLQPRLVLVHCEDKRGTGGGPRENDVREHGMSMALAHL